MGALTPADIRDNDFGIYTNNVRRIVNDLSDEKLLRGLGFSGPFYKFGQADFTLMKQQYPGPFSFLTRLVNDAYDNNVPTHQDAYHALSALSGGNPDRWRRMIENASRYASLDKPVDGNQAQTQLAVATTRGVANANIRFNPGEGDHGLTADLKAAINTLTRVA